MEKSRLCRIQHQKIRSIPFWWIYSLTHRKASHLNNHSLPKIISSYHWVHFHSHRQQSERKNRSRLSSQKYFSPKLPRPMLILLHDSYGNVLLIPQHPTPERKSERDSKSPSSSLIQHSIFDSHGLNRKREILVVRLASLDFFALFIDGETLTFLWFLVRLSWFLIPGPTPTLRERAQLVIRRTTYYNVIRMRRSPGSSFPSFEIWKLDHPTFLPFRWSIRSQTDTFNRVQRCRALVLSVITTHSEEGFQSNWPELGTRRGTGERHTYIPLSSVPCRKRRGGLVRVPRRRQSLN